MEPLYLKGCRHDILGHYLKAIGLLRVLAKCADQVHRDPDAEGWWDMGQACFCLRSEKCPTMGKLVEFFEKHYRPTPLAAGWNGDVGLDEKTAKALKIESERTLALSFSGRVVTGKPEGQLLLGKLSTRQAFDAFRDAIEQTLAECIDAISAPRYSHGGDNPLWLNKSIAGRAHALRTHWEYVAKWENLRTQKDLAAFVSLVTSSLEGNSPFTKPQKGKGTPFFSDAIKAYNVGSGWVEEKFPFNALDYILAVEGAFAMRGTVARTLGANTRRFAAFPFVFDTGENLVNKDGETKQTAAALWFPIWDRHITFLELASFIGDAQARLPGKEVRFSAEFSRALHSQGVDAGFSGWQEFRFKQLITDVPWITTGRYVGIHCRKEATLLNQALTPLDESNFLDQFDLFRKKDGKFDKNGPHRVRATVNAAMETAAHEPTPHHCLVLLESIFSACRQMCVSKSFREKLRGKRASFFQALPMEEWNTLLNPLESQAEFRIARALASITGLQRQGDGGYSAAQPILGSLLPLTCGRSSWFLPEKGDRTQQDVWTGTDLAYDLAAVLRRRYVDSLKDEQPALRAVHGAKLDDVLTFLRGGLDDRLIARWAEAMSLIGWYFGKEEDEDAPERANKKTSEGVEPAYAALRTLLELECESQGQDRGQWKKRRSQQPITLLCQRSASSLPLAVSEALRWISIWGVRNPWGAVARAEKPRITGRYVVRLDYGNTSSSIYDQQFADRLAAAVCIPVRRQDHWQLYRSVTLPPGI
jgi:CRISPR-associated protein Csx17